MKFFLVGLLTGFLLGFVLGALIVGTSRIFEWVKFKMEQTREKRSDEIKKRKRSKNRK